VLPELAQFGRRGSLRYVIEGGAISMLSVEFRTCRHSTTMLPTSAAGGAEMSRCRRYNYDGCCAGIDEDDNLVHLWEQSARWLVQIWCTSVAAFFVVVNFPERLPQYGAGSMVSSTAPAIC